MPCRINQTALSAGASATRYRRAREGPDASEVPSTGWLAVALFALSPIAIRENPLTGPDRRTWNSIPECTDARYCVGQCPGSGDLACKEVAVSTIAGNIARTSARYDG
jgi:hypothetical protein